jgi:hypothetical protein
MRGIAKVAVFLALFLSCLPPLLSNNAFSHGDAPSTCENRYDADITSMTIDNGTQTFDPTNPRLEFDAQMDTGYDVAFTLHTANASSQNNTLAGTTWYRITAFGFGSGVCVDNAGPDQDVPISLHVDAPSGVPDGYEQSAVEWGSWPEIVQITYKVVWHDATDPEPAEEQPPPQDDTGLASNDDESEDDQRDDEPEDDPVSDDIPVGTVISPFIFDNNNDTTAAPETDGSEQLLENVDVLDINGTLASFHFTKDMRLYILSGNWSMAMNGTAVIDFGANFTMVRADGLDRQTYSLGNLTAVGDSDLILGNDTLALTSPLDYRANGTVTRVNATVTLEKLNVVKIETDNTGPIYGVVDKVVRNVNGERQVMASQFDMI